jgi:hypothetical protein
LKAANRKHDVVVIQIVDPRERDLPDVGIIEVRDVETGEVARIDTSQAKVRAAFRGHWDRNHAIRKKLFQSNRLDHVMVSAAEPFERPLVRFFQERQRRHHR